MRRAYFVLMADAPACRGRLPENSIGREAFVFDEKSGDIVLCPMGHAPLRHSETFLHGATGRRRYAYFDGETCRSCKLEGQCIARGPNSGKKGAYHVEVSTLLRARDERLDEQSKVPWLDEYSIRAGVEATMSEVKRAHGLGQLRVRGGPRVLLAIAMKLAACNVKRWLRAQAAVQLTPPQEVQMAVSYADTVEVTDFHFNYRVILSFLLLAALATAYTMRVPKSHPRVPRWH